MRAASILMLVVLCGCGPQMKPDEWQGRLVSVRPFQAALTESGLELEPDPDLRVSWYEGGNWMPPVSVKDGAQIFEVPEGPVLFDVGHGQFVYSRAESIEPCSRRPPIADVDAGIELDLTLAQPAGARELVSLTNAADSLISRTLMPAPGSTTLARRLRWRSPDPLRAGPTIITQLSEALPYDGFDRARAVGMLDAGILDPSMSEPVRGTLEPVAAAGDLNISWDGVSVLWLSANTRAVPFPPRFLALRGGVVIASLSTDTLKRTRVPMVMPALEPDGLLVAGTATAKLEADGGTTAELRDFYGWRAPWPDAPEMNATQLPPTEVRFVAHSVTWAPPAVAPQLYEVRMFELNAAGQYQLGAVIFTDETRVPLPPRPPVGLRIEVIATSGPGLSAAKCTVFEHLESWARLPAFSAPL